MPAAPRSRPAASPALHRWRALALAIAGSAAALSSQVPEATHQPLPGLFEQYCAECHLGKQPDGDFAIDAALADPSGALAERALLRLRSRTMPPPEAGQPSRAERRELQTLLAGRLPAPADAGTSRLRRLAQPEYRQAVRDLFGADLADPTLLPDDAPTYGFDNLGDGAQVSPLVFEQYLDAATAVATAVVGDPSAAAVVQRPGTPLAESLAELLDRAFRQPVGADELDARVRLYHAERQRAGRDAAIAAVVRSVLASPRFLYRGEAERADGRLSNHELATRLAFLLRGSLPDAELRAAAAAGTLHDPAARQRQARRLLAAGGAEVLARRFAAQWLGFDAVLSHNADFRRYPEIWNDGLRPAFHAQALRFFAVLAAEDRSVLELLDSDWTLANGTLRKHYGLGDGQAEPGPGDWQRIALRDRHRGGVLGLGAMLMPSSYPLRTSPVLRGKWILDRLLDTPPPPPPPTAGILPADDQLGDGLTPRQRLERHRRERSCAGCHAQIDPLGFALENFDVLGRWRDTSGGVAIDASAELPDGTTLAGPAALRDALLARADDFVRAFVRQLLVYAAGRPLLPADEPELLRLVTHVEQHEYRFTAVLDAVVGSPIFASRQPPGRRAAAPSDTPPEPADRGSHLR